MLQQILTFISLMCLATAKWHNSGYCGPYQPYGFQNTQYTTSTWFQPQAISQQQEPLASWLNTQWTNHQHTPNLLFEPHKVVPQRTPPAPWLQQQSIIPTNVMSKTWFGPKKMPPQEAPSGTQFQRLWVEKNSKIPRLQTHKVSHQPTSPAPWLQPQTINPKKTSSTSWLEPQKINSHIPSSASHLHLQRKIPAKLKFETQNVIPQQTPPVTRNQNPNPPQTDLFPPSASHLHLQRKIPAKPKFEPQNVIPQQTPPVMRNPNPNPPPTDLFPQSQRTIPSESELESQGTSMQQKSSELSEAEPEPCISTNMEEGVCKPFSKCEPWVTRLLENPQNSRTRDKILLANALCNNKYAVVCCPLQKKKVNRTGIQLKLPTIQDGCGYQERLDAFVPGIVGGEPSELGAWPWIALIGYSGGSKSPFKCGGSLITSRHVLTAAHCVKSSLSFVRLGEHDLSTDAETKHIDVPVSKVLKHPQFDKINGHNDIAMLLLDRTVDLTDKIGTICLPLAPELQENPSFPQRPYVAGWGRTMEGGQPANTLQQLQIMVFNNSDCKDSYEKENKLISQKQFDDSVVCAGDVSGGKDTCQGDSGGPLMDMDIPGFKYRFHLIGIISYGIGCGRPNTPGVYTNVVHFIDWIKNAVNTIHL